MYSCCGRNGLAASTLAGANWPTAVVGLRSTICRAKAAATLERNGFVVVALGTGFEIVQYLAGSILDPSCLRPDLLVLESRMSGCLGSSIYWGLRDLGWSIPIVLRLSEDMDAPSTADCNLLICDGGISAEETAQRAADWQLARRAEEMSSMFLLGNASPDAQADCQPELAEDGLSTLAWHIPDGGPTRSEVVVP